MSAHEPKKSLEMRKEIVGGATGRVLEIGCGTGASFALYPADAQVVATEPDAEMLEACGEAPEGEGHHER